MFVYTIYKVCMQNVFINGTWYIPPCNAMQLVLLCCLLTNVGGAYGIIHLQLELCYSYVHCFANNA